ncbi:hypothetical protein [Flavobacterium sp. J27]|uniref:hypothetical protein n=1 Tax=Flavobacterium sp. J27 TaxID=2060419 RepID=UPI00103167C0|nr:hypothetical protein [Flavobacterium sp. J27]
MPVTLSNYSGSLEFYGKKIVGTWKKDCNEKTSALIVLDSLHGYLDIYQNDDYARVAIDFDKNKIKYGVLTGITRHNNFIQWSDISNDSLICEIIK